MITISYRIESQHTSTNFVCAYHSQGEIKIKMHVINNNFQNLEVNEMIFSNSTPKTTNVMKESLKIELGLATNACKFSTLKVDGKSRPCWVTKLSSRLC